MTTELDWPPDVVALLAEEARQKGLPLDAYILQTVLQQRRSNGVNTTNEADSRRKMEQAAASILELRKGNNLGSDILSAI